MSDLIGLLKERQQTLKETDTEFAVRLGVSQSYWNLCRRGLRRPGIRFIDGVIKAFPDLQSECFQYLGLETPVGQGKML